MTGILQLLRARSTLLTLDRFAISLFPHVVVLPEVLQHLPSAPRTFEGPFFFHSLQPLHAASPSTIFSLVFNLRKHVPLSHVASLVGRFRQIITLFLMELACVTAT
jgi:hypothetical protein